MHEYTFDCVLWSSVWVRAASEEEAREKLLRCLASVPVDFDLDDGNVRLDRVSIEDDGGASELLTIDGKEVLA
jgi:hypothetical protein